MANKKDAKLTSFYAVCPDCKRTNFFAVDDEEIENDYHFACDYCKKEYPLSEYRQVKVWVCHLCGAVYVGERPFICEGEVNGRKCRSNAFLKEATKEEKSEINKRIRSEVSKVS